MRTNEHKLTLSEAIAARQQANWLEGEKKREAEREAERDLNEQRNRFTEKVAAAFMSWFFAETGITDMETAKRHVSLDLPNLKSFAVPSRSSDTVVWNGVTVGWVFPDVDPEVRFCGNFVEGIDGNIIVIPSRHGAWGVQYSSETMYAFHSFDDAVIYVLGLPRETPIDKET